MPGDPRTFDIRSIQSTDKLNKFKLSRANDALRAFLKKNAVSFQETDIAKTYVAVDSASEASSVRAYITIALSEIRKEYAELDVPDAERYPHFPAVKIARLATDVGFEGQGMGSSLIEFVVGLVTKQIMPFVGCRFLILDANPEKIDFYKKRGFFLVDRI